MDKSVRKSWQLAPDQVTFQNPQWQSGMNKMAVMIADRLGYQGIPLKCVLYKLLVYGEGGHFVKHQDTEKEDGMVATLVIQPPSLHEGGDLVVYRDGKVKHRHDFGGDSDVPAALRGALCRCGTRCGEGDEGVSYRVGVLGVLAVDVAAHGEKPKQADEWCAGGDY
jgi:hypothetical protein